MPYDVYVGYGTPDLDAPQGITAALEAAGLSCRMIPRDAKLLAGGKVAIPRVDAARLVLAIVQSGEPNERSVLHQAREGRWADRAHLCILLLGPLQSPAAVEYFKDWETIELKAIALAERHPRIVAAVKAKLAAIPTATTPSPASPRPSQPGSGGPGTAS